MLGGTKEARTLQAFAVTEELLAMGMCGGPVVSSADLPSAAAGVCVGVLEGIVPMGEPAQTGVLLRQAAPIEGGDPIASRISLEGQAAFIEADWIADLLHGVEGLMENDPGAVLDVAAASESHLVVPH